MRGAHPNLFTTPLSPRFAYAAARRAQVLYDFCVARSDLRGAAAAQLGWARRLRAEAPASAAALAETADALGALGRASSWAVLLHCASSPSRLARGLCVKAPALLDAPGSLARAVRLQAGMASPPCSPVHTDTPSL